MSHKVNGIGYIGRMESKVVQVPGKEGMENRDVLVIRLASERIGAKKDASGHRPTDWLTYEAWNGLSKTIAEYYSVGDPINLSGVLRVDTVDKTPKAVKCPKCQAVVANVADATTLTCTCGAVLKAPEKKVESFFKVVVDNFEFLPGVTLKKQNKDNVPDAEMAEGEVAEAEVMTASTDTPAPAGSTTPAPF